MSREERDMEVAARTKCGRVGAVPAPSNGFRGCPASRKFLGRRLTSYGRTGGLAEGALTALQGYVKYLLGFADCLVSKAVVIMGCVPCPAFRAPKEPFCCPLDREKAHPYRVPLHSPPPQ